MKVIYEPKGRAREYAGLALNIYNGCTNACRYCWAPGVMHKKKDDYFRAAIPRKAVVAGRALWSDCTELSRWEQVPEILISFISDPYPLVELDHGYRHTRRVIKTLIEFGLPFTILTKGGLRATRDFDLLKGYPRARFGTTLVFWDQEKMDKWEPHAQTRAQRVRAIEQAKEAGISTWISLEPVIDPDQALQVIRELHPIVDHWKVGKVNYLPDIERRHDWVKFRNLAVALLEQYGADYYIKESLRRQREK